MELCIKLSLAKEKEENKKIRANVTYGLLKTVKKTWGNLCKWHWSKDDPLKKMTLCLDY